MIAFIPKKMEVSRLIETGYIKMFRKLLSWEWYSDIPTTRLFIHLLLTVSIRSDQWMGITIPVGSRIASISTLAGETGLTERQVRTALSHLMTTGAVTRTKYPKFSVLSVVKWEDYQTERQASDRLKQGKNRKIDTDGVMKSTDKSTGTELEKKLYLSMDSDDDRKQTDRQSGKQSTGNESLERHADRQQYKKSKKIEEEKKAADAPPLNAEWSPPKKGTPEYERWRNQ